MNKAPYTNLVVSSVSVLQIIAVHTNSLDQGEMELLIDRFSWRPCYMCIHAVESLVEKKN